MLSWARATFSHWRQRTRRRRQAVARSRRRRRTSGPLTLPVERDRGASGPLALPVGCGEVREKMARTLLSSSRGQGRMYHVILASVKLHPSNHVITA